ncbi:MAG: hypothetical protein HUJ57_05855 [Erysipelotrichaceae bacterium]|nr:hypothetical protein [Erysipelotrichaceae bacterium]
MESIIVYQSLTGFTKTYANWIAEETGLRVMTLQEFAHSDISYDHVVFGTYVRERHIEGASVIRRILNRGKQVTIFAVGACPEDLCDVEGLKASVDTTKPYDFFYMQGGLDLEELGALNWIIVRGTSKYLLNNENAGEREKKIGKMIQQSFDATDRKYIEPLIECLKNKGAV